MPAKGCRISLTGSMTSEMTASASGRNEPTMEGSNKANDLTISEKSGSVSFSVPFSSLYSFDSIMSFSMDLSFLL
jgi:hypothetical protein